ncbi:MAG: DUF721 domain-containing protein [Nitrospirales bacterium]|nr:DUF721 domain-containing protein [Nitrospirales bacterium]
MGAFSSTQSLVPSIAKSYGLDVKILESRLLRDWPKIVGASLASHTRPESIKFRKLVLIAENSAWLQQLVFLKPMILEKLHDVNQETQIVDIILRIGTIEPAKQASISPTNDPVTPTPKSLEYATALTSTIKEPELRALLTTVIAKDLSMTKFPRPAWVD